jgi:hypothetical protein
MGPGPGTLDPEPGPALSRSDPGRESAERTEHHQVERRDRRSCPCRRPSTGEHARLLNAQVSAGDRVLGTHSVKGLITTVLEYYPDFEFKEEDITVLIDTPDQVFAEYVARATAGATGRLVHYLFMGRLVAENGQITLLREGLNTVAAASALLAGGVQDLPEPTNEVHAL